MASSLFSDSALHLRRVQLALSLEFTFDLYVLALAFVGVYFFSTTIAQRLIDCIRAACDVGVWPMAVPKIASIADGWTFFALMGVRAQLLILRAYLFSMIRV